MSWKVTGEPSRALALLLCFGLFASSLSLCVHAAHNDLMTTVVAGARLRGGRSGSLLRGSWPSYHPSAASALRAGGFIARTGQAP